MSASTENTSGEVMVGADKVTKSFGTLEVLKGINLSIGKGEVVAITGASGAGKTTLLQILGTLDKPTSGRVTIDGTDVSSLSGKALAHFRNRKLGFGFQFNQVLPEFTALENVMMPALIGGASRREAEAGARGLLDFLNLSHRAGHKPNEMSGGEKQRAAIARALINKPAVVFADEPSGNLDSHNADELQSLFFSLREEYGQTIAIVTHDTHMAERCDRMIVMKDGLVSEE